MITITLENASNGVIKRIKDDNHNGTGLSFSLTKLYEIDRDSEHVAGQSGHFLHELIKDLDLDLGNESGKQVLVMDTDWGESYLPSVKEISDRIADLRQQIEKLKELKSVIQSGK